MSKFTSGASCTRIALLMGSATIAFAASAPAFAQDTVAKGNVADSEAAAEQAAASGEIVVTARKRAESTREIPESISVITAETLEQKGITNIDQVGLRITNVNLGTRADGNPNVTIRGVGSFGKGPYFFNQENTARHPGYEVANISAGIEAPSWSLRLNVANLFDKGYYSRSGRSSHRVDLWNGVRRVEATPSIVSGR